MRTGVVAVGAVAALLLSVPAVWAEPFSGPGTSGTSDEQGARDDAEDQEPLVEAATVVRESPVVQAVRGLSSIVLGEGEVVLWWRGGESAVPAEVAAVVERASRIAPVRVADARYDREELLAASAELEGSVGEDPGFRSIAAEADGSGLKVVFDRSAQVPDTAGKRAELAEVLPDAEVPVVVDIAPAPEQTSREDDASPWSGGAKLGGCTTGLGVTTVNGPAIWTTAHCGKLGEVYRSAAGDHIGKMTARDETFGVAAISTDAVSGWIHVGGKDGTSYKKVSGASAPFVGQRLCQSGMTSAEVTGGPVCNFTVRSRQSVGSIQLWSAEKEDGGIAARPGDSGGPVYSERSDGSVTAVGIMEAVGGEWIHFVGYDVAQEKLDLSIVTGDTKPPVPPVPPATMKIRGHIGMCMDVRTGGADQPVQLWGCQDSKGQEWYMSKGNLRSVTSCLDVTGGSTKKGAPVQMNRCDDSPSQQWTIGKDRTIRNVASGLCADVPDSRADRMEQLQLSSCSTADSQRWNISTATGPTVPPATPTVPAVAIRDQAGLCVDVAANSGADSATVQLWDCNTSEAQQWFLPEGTGQVLGGRRTCLDVQDHRAEKGAEVQMYRCDDSPSQQWKVDKDSILRNVASGLCVDASESPIRNRMQLSPCGTADSQRWTIGPDTGEAKPGTGQAEPDTSPGTGPTVPPATPTVPAVAIRDQAGLCLDVAANSKRDGATVQLWDCNTSEAQQWFLPEGTGQVLGGRRTCLDVQDHKTEKGVKVQMYRCDDSPSQQWKIGQDGTVLNVASGLCADVPSSSPRVSQPLQLSSCSSADSQRWEFAKK